MNYIFYLYIANYAKDKNKLIKEFMDIEPIVEIKIFQNIVEIKNIKPENIKKVYEVIEIFRISRKSKMDKK